jgi:hypothetical protein
MFFRGGFSASSSRKVKKKCIPGPPVTITKKVLVNSSGPTNETLRHRVFVFENQYVVA